MIAAMPGRLLRAAALAGVAAVAFAACVPAFAAAACREISAPAVIRAPGCVRVVADIGASDATQSILVVYSDGVEIDLGGHTLRGAGAASTAAAIHALGGDDLVVRNGTIKGFLYGIRAEPLLKDRINSVVVERVTVESGGARGIFVQAGRALVHANVVRNLSGYPGWRGSHTIGIEVLASSCWITNNTLSEIYPEGVGEGVGISITEPAAQCEVAGNVLSNSRMPKSGRSIAFWIGADQGGKAGEALAIEDNRVTGFLYGFMAPVAAEPFIQGNTFEVNCTPADLGARGYGSERNRFKHVGAACGDSPAALKVLVSQGDASARIRLAASYIEHQWKYGETMSLAEACPFYELAHGLLDPLVRREDPAALRQFSRLEPLLAACREGSK